MIDKYCYDFVNVNCTCGGTRLPTGTVLLVWPGWMCWECDKCKDTGEWAFGHDGTTFFNNSREAYANLSKCQEKRRAEYRKKTKRVMILGSDLL